MTAEPRFLTDVFRSDYRTCVQCGLALQAAGIDYELLQTAGQWALFVAAHDAVRARDELSGYANETAPPQAVTETPLQEFSGWPGVVGYVLILFAGMLLQHRQAFGIDWFSAGRMQVGLVHQGELWRSVTALTLHGDLVHLLSNLAIGGIVGLFAGQSFGSGLAWLSILLAGGIGNLLTALLRPTEHTSIGASTSVFAALGLLAGQAWMLRRPAKDSRLARFAPIIGGAVLLGFLGTSGERTDVLAHVMGFAAGLALGVLLSALSGHIRRGSRAQVAHGICSILVLFIAWALAITRIR